MNQLPKVSEAELEVMKVFWNTTPPLTAKDVIEQLEKQNDWSPKTIRTLLNRLVQKNAISCNQENKRMYTYAPLISQENYLEEETQSFLKRFYGAALKPLLVNFIKEEKLSSEDIHELKQILDEKNEKNNKKVK
ncbi:MULTISPECIES: BlaI/MecI/CopY family transcriptional regulator [Bacillus]|uniref:BlaI/MecI/CopY family transcriptional regulator n=1 Tax=Bacillus TaxID=1386 RepID=UPI000E35E6D6|nr:MULTISPECIES: BlaI/MecI/CopY family transcriptional regulator [Bacillus]AXR17039.1 BlaI/MecI/CopY family transcriptional regulator [Bacillus sp. CR71]AXR22733.1 BlaI/MecI/CopY family transcriptional regulator [Bacillus sp. E25]KAA6458910.1 BlaI/MecI/CopY family transcriptional regulator [Bacillus cereus]KAB2412520.1 BlaI/MecI/CopY family transcriptional regulator [Bacillus cereus]KAB2435162.1 BlaI/MecI/CopY family transcriptional regulator [Bacillus cereus]